MTRRLPSAATFIALAFCVTALRADLAVSPMRRLPGSSLDTSVRNEADRAIRQATRWLADRQQPDGSWGGESNRVRHTSLALAALAAASQSGQSDAIARAAVWLGGTETNRLDTLSDHAWRLIALDLAVPGSPARQQLFLQLIGHAESALRDAPEDDLRFWHEALNQSNLSPAPSPAHDHATNVLVRIASEWPPPFDDTRAAWQLTHLINRTGNAQLLNGTTPIDWRTHIAEHLINSQKSDPRGGGYWPADTPDRQIVETAYGLLCLLEL